MIPPELIYGELVESTLSKIQAIEQCRAG